MRKVFRRIVTRPMDRIGLNRGLSKKGIAPLLMGFGLIILILVGYIGYSAFKKEDIKPLPNPNPVPYPIVNPTPILPTVCKSTQLVLNGQCVDCPSGTIPVSGICQQTQQTTTPSVNPGFTPLPGVACEVKGYFIDSYLNTPNAPIGLSAGIIDGLARPMISYRFQLQNTCDANIYVEGGIIEQKTPLTLLVTQPSACDGNAHYAGKFLVGNSNTKFDSSSAPGVINVAFFPQDYGQEGTYPVTAGVYSGCLNAGGKTIAEVPLQKVKFYHPCGTGCYKAVGGDWYTDSKGACYPTTICFPNGVQSTPFIQSKKII